MSTKRRKRSVSIGHLKNIDHQSLSDFPKNIQTRGKKTATETQVSKTEENVKMNIMNFSDEVIVNIFRYLPTYDILRKIPVVCQRFYRLSKDSTIIKELYVCGKFLNLINDGTFLEVLRRSREITALNVEKFAQNRTDKNQTKTLLYNAFNFCPKLIDISIENENYSIDENFMKEIAIACPRLQSLKLSKVTIEPRACAQIVQMRNLQHLKISCRNFTSENLITLSQNCKNLQYFDASENWFTQASVTTLITERKLSLKGLYVNLLYNITDSWFQKLSLCENLEELGIFGDGDHFCQKIKISEISKLKQLKILRLDDVFIGQTAKDLNAIFKNLKKLEKLTLRNFKNHGSWSVEQMFRGRNLTNLLELRLYSGDKCISDSMVTEISAGCPKLELLACLDCYQSLPSLSKFKNLNKLYLDFTYVKYLNADEFMCLFSKGNFSNLTELELKNSLFLSRMDKVVECLAFNCQQLKKLNLSGSNCISENCINFLLKNCKNLQELHLSGCNLLNCETEDCSKIAHKYSKQFLLQVKKKVPKLYWDGIFVKAVTLDNFPSYRFNGSVSFYGSQIFQICT